jgi:hypothetical protein
MMYVVIAGISFCVICAAICWSACAVGRDE